MATRKKRRRSAANQLARLKHNTELYSLFNERLKRAQQELRNISSIVKKLKPKKI